MSSSLLLTSIDSSEASRCRRPRRPRQAPPAHRPQARNEEEIRLLTSPEPRAATPPTAAALRSRAPRPCRAPEPLPVTGNQSSHFDCSSLNNARCEVSVFTPGRPTTCLPAKNQQFQPPGSFTRSLCPKGSHLAAALRVLQPGWSHRGVCKCVASAGRNPGEAVRISALHPARPHQLTSANPPAPPQPLPIRERCRPTVWPPALPQQDSGSHSTGSRGP